jgi:large repetitive protein
LSNLTIQNTAGSGIDGTQVVDFTFDNGTITGSGNTNGEGNITFNGSGSLSDGNHLSGVVVITDSILNTAFDSGIHLESTSGTISDLTVSNNAFTSTTDTATSKGDATKIITRGNAATVANVTRATIANNQIANFPSGGGIQVNGGNANGAGPGGTLGTPGSGTNLITITENAIAGASAANRMNTSPILFAVSGGNAGSRSQGNALITNNGTIGAPVRDFVGTGIGIGNNGNATSTVTVDNNVLVANNSLASQGIGGGNGVVLGCAAGTCESPDLTLTVTNNNISQTDGNGILLVGRGNLGLAKLGIRNNTVAAPLTGVRPGIRVDAGNASAGSDDAVCLDISGNTTAGSGGSEGIGLRKAGHDVHRA